MHIGKYDITPKNIGSFFRGMKNKFGHDLGFKTLSPSQQNQVILRSIVCSDCTTLGHCKGCNCMTPHMFYDPLKEDHFSKWGQMMDEQTWQNFLKGKEEMTPEDLAKEYENTYRQARMLNITITPQGAILSPQTSLEVVDAQASTDEEKEAPGPSKASLTLGQDVITQHVGRMVTGQIVTRTFTLTNTTDIPIQIRSVGVACGCTVPTFDKDVIPAGESFAVTLTYTAQSPGFNVKTATVSFAQDVDDVILTLQAHVDQ